MANAEKNFFFLGLIEFQLWVNRVKKKEKSLLENSKNIDASYSSSLAFPLRLYVNRSVKLRIEK